MKRRNIDVGKPPRRPTKRANKFTDSVYGSSFIYLKFLVVWMLILLADFILEFRFEYIWPLWLLIQSVYDTFKYQGLAYSVFFVCVAITSDTVCLLFIPIQWLFFMASTYVWIHYVWQTEKGICLPTVSLWLLFMYIESTMRLRDLRNGPFHVDLCRPFAAHCIGHPVVTLGIGLKSYVTYRLKLRTQRDVQKDNNFYYELLKQALPKESQQNHTLAVTEKHEDIQNNGIISTNKKPVDKSNRPITLQQDSSMQIAEIQPPAKNSTSGSTNSSSTTPSSSGSTTSVFTRKGNSPAPEHEGKRRSVSTSKKSENSSNQSKVKSGSGNNSPKSNKNNSRPDHSTSEVEKHRNHITPPKVDHSLTNGHAIVGEKDSNPIEIISAPSAVEILEATISKLKEELNCAQKREIDLKNRLDLFSTYQCNAKSDLESIKKENEVLQTRLTSANSSKQKERQTISALEKKLKLESDHRVAAERLLSEEKRRRREDEETATRAAAAVKCNREKESAEVLSRAKKDLEEEISKIQHNLSLKDDECNSFKREVQELQLKEKSAKESETLMSALEAMQDKNLMLENSLSAETRLKLDLFSALGDVKRQLELAHVEIYKRDGQIQELKTRMSDILSLLPESRIRSPTPHYSANFLEKPQEFGFNPRPPLLHLDPAMMAPVHLDPNAAMYTPSTSGV